MLKGIKIVITLIILAVIFIVGYQYWLHQQRYPSTDDAYVQSNVVNIAPSISGHVNQIAIQDHQQVKTRQLLFTIEPLEYEIALNKAKSELAEVKMQVATQQQAINNAQATVKEHQVLLTTQKREYNRVLSLVKQGVMASQDGDEAQDKVSTSEVELATAKSNLANAKTQLSNISVQVNSAKAGLRKAKLDLDHTHVFAPSSGVINNMNLRVGDAVNAYQSVFALVDNRHYWISANFKETQLPRIHVGQPAYIRVDMYPGQLFNGEVSSISTSSGTSFSLIPTEQATGNWVKVTQRFPVKIVLKENMKQLPLRIGASATVSIDTATHSAKR